MFFAIPHTFVSLTCVFPCLSRLSGLSEKEGKQLGVVADAPTAAARAGGHPATLTQHTRPQRRRYGRRLGVLGPQGGACSEGQRPAQTLLCSHGYCWSQVGSAECGRSSDRFTLALVSVKLSSVDTDQVLEMASLCRPTDEEAEQLLQLMTSRPPATPAGVRFVSLSFCKLLAFPHLVR